MENTIFSGRANHYKIFRVDYPDTLHDFLSHSALVKSGDIVADIGSGTGLLSRWFLQLGAIVYGVEPNEDMRKIGEQFLAEFPEFNSIPGSAENTTLKDSFIDLICVGNAFHWFDHARAKPEWKRILKPGARVFLIRTDWKSVTHERMKKYDDIVMKYCIGRNGIVTDPALEQKCINEFFASHKKYSLPESETLYTLEQLKGRFLSTSFSPKPGHPHHDSAMNELENLFTAFKKNGHFSFCVTATIIIGNFIYTKCP